MDIRNKNRVEHEDMVGLNFILDEPSYVFKYHRNQGLRSHVVQVISPNDYRAETEGIEVNGRKEFPRAVPDYVFRIYRSKIEPEEAMEDIKKIKVVREYLKENMAYSNEFIASYKKNDGAQENYETILCGLQEFIKGDIIDPWFCVPESYDDNFKKETIKAIDRVKECIHETGYIPDLAGRGNFIYGKRGVVLTDINNINKVDFSSYIYIDNKGFPIVDTSIEALSELEKAVKGSVDSDLIYEHYLEPSRKSKCLQLRKEWSKKQDEELPFFGAM